MKQTIQFTTTLNCTMTRDFTESELEILNDEDSSELDIEDVIFSHDPDLDQGEIQSVDFDGFQGEQSGPCNKNKEK